MTKKISELPVAAPLTGAELFEVSQLSGGTYDSLQTTAADIANTYSAVLPVANGGTGAATLTGYVKGAGTSAMTASATIPYADLAGRAYLSAYDTTDQTGSTSAATAVKINTTAFSQGISITNNGSGNPTRITFAAAGIYMIAPSLQFANSDGTANHVVTVWGAKNGVAIPATATKLAVPKSGDGGSAFFQIVAYEQLAAGDYIEVMWLPDNAAVTIDYLAAGAIAPSNPSIILVAERIA